MLKKIYIQAEPGQIVYLVFTSTRAGGNKNIVLKCEVESIQINKERTIYTAKVLKCATDKKHDISKYCHLWFTNANIDTGYGGNAFCYPVFTTKEKCIEWLKS